MDDVVGRWTMYGVVLFIRGRRVRERRCRWIVEGGPRGCTGLGWCPDDAGVGSDMDGILRAERTRVSVVCACVYGWSMHTVEVVARRIRVCTCV